LGLTLSLLGVDDPTTPSEKLTFGKLSVTTGYTSDISDSLIKLYI
jgi:hypothetical protein